MSDKPQVSIVLGSYNRLDFLKLAIASARQEVAGMAHEIIVVDGGSDDGSAEWLILQKDIISIIQHNRGEWDGKPLVRKSWGYFMNLAFRSAQADAIVMMSDDTVFHAGALKNGLEFLHQQQAAGHKVGAIPFYFHDVGFDPADTYKISVLFGHPFVNHGIYVREAFAQIGYADETTYGFFAADADICYRLIDAGYEVIPCKTALMLHCPYHPLRHVNTPSERWMVDVRALVDKWGGVLIPKDVAIIHGYTDTRTVHFVDESGLARVFDRALEAMVAEETVRTGDADTRLDQLENRLNSLLAAVRYNIRLTEQTAQAVQALQGAGHVPYYRRALSTWAVFAPLRKLKRRLAGK